MDQPKTLMDFAGVARHPAPLAEACLVLIDPQREYVDGQVRLAGIDAAVEGCARLLALARANGVPVIHVLHHARPGAALFDPEGPYAAPIPSLAPAPGEAVVIKALPNAFTSPGFEAALANTGRRQLILAGFATHMCISATARATVDKGFLSTIVADACATRDLPNPVTGGVVPAHIVHETALAALHDRFAVVVLSSDAWARQDVG
jgi:nicotinamidase-related amidase